MYKLTIQIEDGCTITKEGTDRKFLERLGYKICKEAAENNREASYIVEVLR